MNSRLRITFLALLASLLSGCSVMKTYPGSKLPPEQVARIEGTFGFWLVAAKTVELVSVDDTPATAFAAEVMPGTHTVSVKYFSDVLNVIETSRAPCFITLQAEPGHTYQVDGEKSGGVWHCWADDVDTGQRVDGTFTWPSGWKRGADVQTEP